MKNRNFIIFLGILALGLLAGCATTQVKRIDEEKTLDLSGRWNDTDSRLVAKALIDDCTEGPWAGKFQEKKGRLPVIIVGLVKNQSQEHINAEIFTKDMEHNLLNSGKAKFVASRQERGEIREEREDQQKGLTDPETIKAIGKETGADFMLIGSVNSEKDETKGRYVIRYQVNLELVDLETNQKVWIGQTYLKKEVQQSKYSL